LFFYSGELWNLFDILNTKTKADLDILLKILLKAYEILRELNPDERRKVPEIVHRLNSILRSPENIDLKIDTRILGLIKIPIELRELNKEKIELESELNRIYDKLEYKRELETIPGELENDPEVKELIEREKYIRKRLKEIENRIRELREEWERLRSNKKDI